MLLPLTQDRFEIDEFYGLDKYPQTTAIYSDNMLVFNYLARYWIMNGSTLIGSSSSILTEYYENYKDRVVHNGSFVVLEGEIPDGVHVLFLTEDKKRANIISRMINDGFSEQRLGIVGMHTHDIVGERRRKICWDDLPRTTWKSEQDEPDLPLGLLLGNGRNTMIAGRKTAIRQATDHRVKIFDKELIRFGEDVEELGSLEEYMEFLRNDNLNNNCHIIIPNVYEHLKKYYRSEIIENFSETDYRSHLIREIEKIEEGKKAEFEKELDSIEGERLVVDFSRSKKRVFRHWKKLEMRDLEQKVSKFVKDKEDGIHEGYPRLKLVGALSKMRRFMDLLDKTYCENGIVTTFTLPVVGIKVTRQLRVFRKEVDGYQGAMDDLVLSLLGNWCLFVFNDLGDKMVTDFSSILVY